MLVVLPYCFKDEHLALKNLELIKKLDGKTNYSCLLTYDSDTKPDAVEALAKECFSEVKRFQYDKWGGAQAWPAVQNWAWQETARHIYTKFRDKHWLWWEADATPLVGGWLDKLSAKYAAGNRPFMGHIVHKMGHMNGVAVYPGNVLQFSHEAMLAKKSPWDVVLKDYIIRETTPANDLMFHFPRYNGITLSFTDKAALKELRKRGAVLFHGCNDGTLIDLVAGRKPVPKVNGFNRYFKVEDIDAEFDEAEPFWQSEYVRLNKIGYGCLDYHDCRKQLPGFREQTEWESGQFNLTLTESICHFNCGLVRDGNNALWLLARKWDRSNSPAWHSSMNAYKLDDNLNPVVHVELQSHKRDYSEQHEDPRVIWHNGQFWVSYCSWTRSGPYSAKQVFASFDSSWTFQRTIRPQYGKNLLTDTGIEKNWIWFNHDGAWYFVYQFYPHIVVRMGNEMPVNEFKTDQKPKWDYGEIRGGTPPVRVGDEYISFFHSSLPWKNRQKRYYAGAYAFEAKAPFRITRMTSEPLLAGSDKDSRTLGGPPVIFPCGALLEKDKWLVSFGVNDETCGWIKIPTKDLEKRLCSI